MKQRFIQAAVGALSAAIVSFVGAMMGADPASLTPISVPLGAAASVKAQAIAEFVTSAFAAS